MAHVGGHTCVAGGLCAWVPRLHELLQQPQDKQGQRQPEAPRAEGIKPHLAAPPRAWGAARSPQTSPAFLYVASDNKDALATFILEGCLTCFHSG